MNLVAGVASFPVPAGLNMSLTRSEDAVCQMEAQGWEDLAAVLRRNLAVSQGLHTVDTLLLALCVQEVLNFDQQEQERMAEEVLAQDWVVEGEMDCFRGLVAK